MYSLYVGVLALLLHHCIVVCVVRSFLPRSGFCLWDLFCFVFCVFVLFCFCGVGLLLVVLLYMARGR